MSQSVSIESISSSKLFALMLLFALLSEYVGFISNAFTFGEAFSICSNIGVYFTTPSKTFMLAPFIISSPL